MIKRLKIHKYMADIRPVGHKSTTKCTLSCKIPSYRTNPFISYINYFRYECNIIHYVIAFIGTETVSTAY
jgi:hypothetical protein